MVKVDGLLPEENVTERDFQWEYALNGLKRQP